MHLLDLGGVILLAFAFAAFSRVALLFFSKADRREFTDALPHTWT